MPRIQLECVTCRYGVSVLVAPERCPMCGGAAWEPALRVLSPGAAGYASAMAE